MMDGKQRQPETQCPECGGPISWKVIHGALGRPQYNGICPKCNIVLRDREAPDIKRGKSLYRDGIIDGTPVRDMHCMDKRITSLPCDVQIGILREEHRQLVEEQSDE